MRKLLLFIIAIAIITTFSACRKSVHASLLMNLKIGMTKDQVINTLGGPPDIHRGSITNMYGQIIDVWEYLVNRGKTSGQIAGLAFAGMACGVLLPIALSEGTIEYYWLFFHNDILVQWGRAGDWNEANRKIYEIRFGQ